MVFYIENLLFFLKHIYVFPEIEETRNKKCLQWDAIKRTYNMYKVRLDMHISLEEEKDHQYIKVAFFIHNKNTKDKYFVQLSHSSNCWKGM